MRRFRALTATVGAIWRRVALALLILALLPAAQAAETLRGVALVIGQSDYGHLPDLANPANDARDVEELLSGLGFDTTVRDDRDAAELKRDLDRFIEDAEAADVAILYYSGHGIEAGGQNFLVPVDADLSALEAAAEKLVALSSYIERLKAAAPLVIVMLDACRDNPFPGDAMVRVAPGEPPAPIGAAGLGETRSVAPLKAGETAAESLGTIIAFAAEPGRSALDGQPGGTSPYAAAVIRHLDAMTGAEFGTVMRMVSEEVYLKTQGKQRPWMNESLHRLLYFGAGPEAPAGEEGDILKERRQLLITIAALPAFDRRQVEAVAASAAVPMDALYGMLRALGADAPKDPVELDKLLRGQTDRLKELLAEQAALKSTDAEIVRLSALADQALTEGAFATALALHERAKARVGVLAKTVEAAEADIKARRIEFAEVFERSAEAYALSLQDLNAAADYARAFEQVERWDARLAWRYKLAVATSLIHEGDYKGSNAALERAIAAGESALELAKASAETAKTKRTIAYALQVLGKRDQNAAMLQRAIELARDAVDAYDRKTQPLQWAEAQRDLGIALWALGEHGTDAAPLHEAVAVFNTSLEEATRERAPLDWAMTKNHLGNVLWTLGNNLNDWQWMEQAASAYLAALDELDREREPLDWAVAQYNLGRAYIAIAEDTTGILSPEHAVEPLRAALGEFDRARMPFYWAATQNALCSALKTQAEAEPQTGTSIVEEAIAACRLALEEQTRDRTPVEWAGIQTNLGEALALAGLRETGTATLKEAAVAFRSALQEWTREHVPYGWSWARINLGQVLIEIGRRERSKALIADGRAEMMLAWDVYKASGQSDYDGYFNGLLEIADKALAELN